MNRMELAKIKRRKETVEKGVRVELIQMEGEQGMEPGLQGTVQFVDDMGTVFVKWDNGRGLGLALEDSFRIL